MRTITEQEKKIINQETNNAIFEFEESLKERVSQINTLYKLAYLYAKLRKPSNKEKIVVSSYHTAVANAIANPMESKFITVLLLVKALGGNLVIEWGELPESLRTEASSYINKLEAENKKLKEELEALRASLLK
jgi:hypothetical protein